MEPLLDGRGSTTSSEVELGPAPLPDAEQGSHTMDRRVIVQGRESAARVTCGPLLGRYYLVYCVTCMVVAGLLLFVTIFESLAPRPEARVWRRRLRPWEEGCEAFIGAALCTETLGPLCAVGARAFFRDRWRVLDAAVAGLTLVCGVFFLFRRVIHHAGDMVEDVDVPMLCLRFALQPFRMVSTTSMVVRASLMQRGRQRQPAEEVAIVDPRRATERECSALTPELAAQLRELLPVYLQFVEWELAYSPRVHGTSLNTFYRRQAGPNLLVVRDAHGGLFGGFATEPWRPQAGAYGANGEAFVFVARTEGSGCCGGMGTGESAQSPQDSPSHCRSPPAVELEPPASARCQRPQAQSANNPAASRQLEVFWASAERGRVVQWSDSKMLGLGSAVVVCDDFLRGSSLSCEAFGSRPLSPAGTEFVIRDFECWHIGCPDVDG